MGGVPDFTCHASDGKLLLYFQGICKANAECLTVITEKHKYVFPLIF